LTKGEQKNNFRIGRTLVVGCFVAVAIVVFLKESDKGPTTGSTNINSPAMQAVSTKAAATVPMPNDEVTMIGIIQRAAQAYQAAGSNELQAGSTRPTRASALCEILKGNVGVRNWTGTISRLTTNGDGKGVIAISVAPDIEIVTWNNSFSDMSDRTLLEPGSQIYQSALALKIGQAVMFSGTFIRGTSDCVKESSMTMYGSMTSPNFIFRFSDIGRL
jgi:hypothetical protein